MTPDNENGRVTQGYFHEAINELERRIGEKFEASLKEVIREMEKKYVTKIEFEARKEIVDTKYGPVRSAMIWFVTVAMAALLGGIFSGVIK